MVVAGIVDAIKVKKRDAGLALGANLDDYREVGWNATARGFDDVLELLKAEYGGNIRGSSEKKKKSSKTSKEKKKKGSIPIVQVGMK